MDVTILAVIIRELRQAGWRIEPPKKKESDKDE